MSTHNPEIVEKLTDIIVKEFTVVDGAVGICYRGTRYAITTPDFIENYLPSIAERIEGLSVDKEGDALVDKDELLYLYAVPLVGYTEDQISIHIFNC
jgi:hypothetical protein